MSRTVALVVKGAPLELAGHGLVVVEEGRGLKVEWPPGSLVLLPREYCEALAASGHVRMAGLRTETREYEVELPETLNPALAGALLRALAPRTTKRVVRDAEGRVTALVDEVEG